MSCGTGNVKAAVVVRGRYDKGGESGDDGENRNPRWIDENRLEIGVVSVPGGVSPCC